MVDYKMLHKALKDSGVTKIHIAKLLNVSENTITSKLIGQTQFKANELYLVKNILHLSDDLFIKIFFATECELNSPFNAQRN